MTASAIVEQSSAVEATPDLREESLDNVTLRVDIQPVTMFENNQGEVHSIVATNNFVVAYRTLDNGWRVYSAYDEAGRACKTGKFPAFVITGADIEQVLRQNGQNIASSSSYGMAPEKLAELLRMPQEVAQLKHNLSAAFPNKSSISSSDFGQSKNWHFIAPPSTMRNDSSERRIVFMRGEELYIYEVKNEKDEVLAPNQWKLTKIKNTSRITEKQLAETPVLREFCGMDLGVPVGKTNRAVNLERGTLSVLDIKKNERIFSIGAAGYAVDPSDDDTVHIITADGKELQSLRLSEAKAGSTDVETRELNLAGEIRDMRMDPNGNFFIIRLVEKEKKGEKSKIVIIQKDTLQTSAEIADVGGSFDLDAVGNIYFIDAGKKLRMAQINFMSLPKGDLQSVRDQRKDELRKLADKISSIDLSAVEAAPQDPQQMDSEHEIITHLAGEVDKRFAPELENSKSLAQLTDLAGRIDTVKAQDDFSQHPEVFAAVEERVAERIRTIQITELFQALDKFEGVIEAVSDAAQMVEVNEGLAELSRQRRAVLITDTTLRKSIDDRLNAFEAAKSAKISVIQEELSRSLGEGFKEVKELIDGVGTVEELRAIIAATPVVEFDRMRMLLSDPEKSRSWRVQYSEAIKARSDELAQKLKAEQAAELQRVAVQLEETREMLDQIKDAAKEEVSDVVTLSRWTKGNPLITAYRARVLALTEDLREVEDDRLDLAIAAYRRELEQRTFTGIKVAKVTGIPGRMATFGDETFPVFQPTPDEAQDRRVPDFNPRWVLNEFNRTHLSEMARISRLQVERQDGILILEGEAGCGKNMLCDIFSHFTNRQVYTFPSNFQTVKEDLTYDFGFDPKQGTYRIDSKLIDALQTPGSIVVFDEINTLPPGLAKMLNSLLDYRRTLYLPDGRAIKADPSVIIMGTMNPQHYIGVQRLSQEVVSRARILYIGYPPEVNNGKFTPWEAEILAKGVDCLKDLKQSEFYLLWDHAFNNDTSNGGDKFATTERVKAVQDLRHVVKTATKLREAYRAFRMGVSQEMIEFVFSLRESEAIAYDVNKSSDVKRSIKDVVLPKIGDPMERERVKAVIDNV